MNDSRLNLLLTFIIFFFSQNLWASTKIPVRLAFAAGYHASGNSFDGDRKDKSLGSIALGGDFNTELSKNTIIGLTGWIVPPVISGNQVAESFYIASLYLGYKAKAYDLFIGPGLSSMNAEITSNKASPNVNVELNGTLGCGVLGGRYYATDKIRTGFGLSAYYCYSSSYDKKVQQNSSTVPTSAPVGKDATSGGIFLYLFISWDEKRKLS